MLCNQQLTNGYKHLTEGKLKEAVEEYQKALKVTYSDSLKVNIKCTIAVILHSQGNYDQVIDIVSPLLKNPH
jgi:predicted negative regulator of RcsB-dependent stress response